MRVLCLTTLYPSSANEAHGIFVEHRLRQVMRKGCVEAVVIAPVPWFPWRSRLFGRYGAFGRAPMEEVRHGVHVVHPRYVVVPKVGMRLAPYLLERGALGAVKKIEAECGPFDLIDAHYLYPDGVAAARVAQKLKKPLILTARGTDVNLIPNYPFARRMILEAVEQADRVVCVCRALKERLLELGAPKERLVVFRNGVDLDLFRPVERAKARESLGLTAHHCLLSVGHLIPRKGHDLVINALASLRDCMLLIVGEGPDRKKLQRLAEALGVAGRVRFVGKVPQADLARYYSAADALVLASSREGWANVLLEAMACGTPVVATSVWGTPEVVAAPEAGILVEERTPEAIAAAVLTLLRNPPPRERTRAYAERFGWDEVAQGVADLFAEVAAEYRQRRGAERVPQRKPVCDLESP